ncbi:MAG TPA: carboxymuconolactone decarboxylase family protein [Methylomirabilota bacterium]|jgi:AhpD family alkylhydroperoxidase|nr:carboxymuconolactone decarboxylase family protein [Methylomirabilota bacterium]
MPRPPKPFLEFTRQNPGVGRAYEALGAACGEAGPLDAKTRELVKLGLAIGGRLEGAVHSHVRRAREAGATAAEIGHVVALATPTLGLPTTVAAYTWVRETLAPEGLRRRR